MTTKMKSFRFDEWTANTIEDISDELGISQAAVIRLAIHAFKAYGIDQALIATNYMDNSAEAYSTLIGMSQHGGSISDEIRSMLSICASQFAKLQEL